MIAMGTKPKPKKVTKAWKFLSSNGVAQYETLLYSDGSTSCNCPGWTRRQERTCKHTRAVALGTADNECENFATISTASPSFVLLPINRNNDKGKPLQQPPRHQQPATPTGRRKLRFK